VGEVSNAGTNSYRQIKIKSTFPAFQT
jgi:hypothetical protein